MLLRTTNFEGNLYALEIFSSGYGFRHHLTKAKSQNWFEIPSVHQTTIKPEDIPETVKIKLGLIQKYRIYTYGENCVYFLSKHKGWGSYTQAMTFDTEEEALAKFNSKAYPGIENKFPPVYVFEDSLLAENMLEAYIVRKNVNDKNIFVTTKKDAAMSVAAALFNDHADHVFSVTSGQLISNQKLKQPTKGNAVNVINWAPIRSKPSRIPRDLCSWLAKNEYTRLQNSNCKCSCTLNDKLSCKMLDQYCIPMRKKKQK